MSRGGRAGAPGPHGLTAAILVAGAAVVVASEFVVIGLAPAVARELAIPLGRTGWLVAAFSAGSAVLGPMVVAAARRMPSRQALSLSLLPFAASALAPAVETLWPLALLRLAQGAALPLFIGSATEALGAGRSAEASGDGQAVARIYLGVLIGSVAAAPGGAFLAHLWGWRAPLVALGLLALVVSAMIMASPALRSTRAVAGDRQAELNAFATRAVAAALLISFLQFAAMFAAYSYLAGILEAFGVGRDAVAPWMLAFGLAGLLGNSLAGRTAAWALGRAALVTALVIGAAAASLPLLTASPILLAPVLIGWGAAHAAAFVLCQRRVSLAAPGQVRMAAALNISAANVGIFAGAALGGLGLDRAGIPGVAAVSALFTAATVVVCLATRSSLPVRAKRSPFPSRPRTPPSRTPRPPISRTTS